MAQLKSGSTVGGSAILTAATPTGVPAGTVMVFHQAAAPTGWTKSTSHNNKALRVVSGSGGGYGGTHDLTGAPSTAHSHSTPNHSHNHSLSAGSHTLSVSQMPGHTHPHNHSVQGPNYGNGHNQISRNTKGGYQPRTGNNVSPHGPGGNCGLYPSDAVSSDGGGSSHSHSISGSISSGGSGTSGSSSPTAFAPKYIDVIVATKN
jgi:hypothetical protein